MQLSDKAIKNKYCNRAKISESKTREILRYFAADLDASQTAKLSGLNRNTVNRYIKEIRERISELCEKESPFNQQIGIDKAFFGSLKNKKDLPIESFSPSFVFGLIKNGLCVHTQLIPDKLKPTVQAIIRGHLILDNAPVMYDGLVDVRYNKLLRIEHGNNEFTRNHNHFNVIEGFWGITKTRLFKFRGINKNTFNLHLKECEFRYNYRQQDIYKILLKMLREKPLF